jgi:tRNA(adenine34) deaminase
MTMRRDDVFMARALALAEHAGARGEVPVGAVLVVDDQIVGEGWNQPISLHDPSAHAEVMALRDAGERLQAYRLPDSTLYVTLEPCCMCLGAIIHARVARLVFGANDPKTGACGGALELHEHPSHNHVIEVDHGLEAERCGALLRAFFTARR